MAERLEVEVVFATPERQDLSVVDLPVGATVTDALQASGIDARFPELAIGDCAVGIWGRVVERDAVVSDGDRVETYRPLQMDPRDARRRLANTGRTMSQPGGGQRSGDNS